MIVDYLAYDPRRYANARLLHVGVGNCALPTALMAELGEYVGITISLPEIALFERTFPELPNAAILLNKYDPRMYVKLDGEFDLIVDTLLKSVACCDKHFRMMMVFYASILKPGGALLTTESGLSFGWPGNTARAYTPGAATDPAVAQLRRLHHDELALLAEALQLTITAGAADAQTGDHIVFLTKGIQPEARFRAF